ncbi:MAG TPA: LacI family DNA-binding transcriptional regulator [Steroidobacteraceae bacterium]|nr:LacI family DNA-binding transcriptional regulator [Steroidobacteraceae bacterium]
MSKEASARRGPATIQMVADRARVSPKTVSRVINNERGVREETRHRILEAIQQLDYQPNLNARGLAGARSFLIGLFYDKPGDYLSEFQTGAVQRCRESDLHLMVQPLDIASKDMARDVSMLVRQLRLEGVILLPPLSDHAAVRTALAEADVPSVHIAPMREPADSPSVDTDDRAAAGQMTVELLDRGHRRIGFMLGPPGHRATEQRYLGFADAMHARGVTIDPELVHTGNFEFADGLECARRILGARSRPTAIFASNDDMAAAAACIARQMGLELPGQLSIAGFDDAPIASMTWPQLATVHQPVRHMGRIATDLIIQHRPHRHGWPNPMPRPRLDLELMVRESIATARS